MTTVSARPARLQWSITRGDDPALTLTFEDANGAAIDLSGRTYDAQAITQSYAAAQMISVSTASAASGVLVLSMTDTITALLTEPGYLWFLKETNGTTTTTLLDGPLNVGTAGGAGVGSGSSSATVTVRSDAITIACSAAVSGGPLVAGSTFPGGVLLDGSSGCNVSSPDSAGLSITGDIDIAVRVAANDWSPSSEKVFASKWTNSNGAKSWIFAMDSTTLFAYFSDDGTNAVSKNSASAPLLNDGETGWVRVTRAKTSGDTTFYWAYDSVDLPNNWTALGAAQVILAGSDIFDSTTAVKLGGVGNIAWDFAGRIYRTVIRAGIRGTIRGNADFTSMGNPTAAPAASTYTDSIGNVWTMNGTAAIQSATIAAGDSVRWNGAAWVPSAQ